MATRRELTDAADALAKALGRTVDTSGMSRATLEALVLELEAASSPVLPAAGEDPATTDTASQDGPAPPGPAGSQEGPPPELPPVARVGDLVVGSIKVAPPAGPLVDGAAAPFRGGPPTRKPKTRKPPNVPFYVAPGKSTVIGGKVAGPYTPVKANDFERGKLDLDYLVDRGVVVRNE